MLKRYTILYLQNTLGLGLGLPQSSSYKLLACTAYYDNSNVVEPFINTYKLYLAKQCTGKDSI